jgi:hypothetical protein
MKFFMIFPYYLYWHYTKGFKELIYNFSSVIIFEFHFFSIKELLFTLFSPFQRLQEKYSNNILDIKDILSSFFINIVMRTIGFICRSIIITIGLFVLCITAILLPFIIIIWLVLPFALVFLIGVSIWSYITHKI